MKIQKLVEPDLAGKKGMRLLEVGAGSGAIAHYFATEDARIAEASAVDVRDQRVVREGYRFTLYDGLALPFEDAAFDIVISNHVIEHVGSRIEQLHHLQELARVLRPGGVAYFAAPSRWQFVEPHFRLPALSWIPRAWRSAYVRLARRGGCYDCDPLDHRGIERLFKQVGFQYRNRNVDALRLATQLDLSTPLAIALVRIMPSSMMRALYRFSPTMVYTATIGHSG